MLRIFVQTENLHFPKDWLNDVDQYVDIDQLSKAELYHIWHTVPDDCEYIEYAEVLIKELEKIAKYKTLTWR